MNLKEIYEQIAYMEKRAKELNLALKIYCEALAVLKSQKWYREIVFRIWYNKKVDFYSKIEGV